MEKDSDRCEKISRRQVASGLLGERNIPCDLNVFLFLFCGDHWDNGHTKPCLHILPLMQAGNLVFIIIDRTQNTPLQSCEGSGQVEVRNHLVYVKVTSDDAVTEHSDRRDRGR